MGKSSAQLKTPRVPAPWTAVKTQATASGATVKVWGREYRFQETAFPTSILTVGEEILAAPIRLVGLDGGKPIEWNRGGVFVLRSDPTQATVSGWQASERVIVNTSSVIEFDGLMRTTIAVATQRVPLAELQQLWLEVPLKTSRASLFTYWPGGVGADNSGAVPAGGLALPFKPMLWLGWEEGGLSWVAESDQSWTPSDRNRSLEVVPQGETTLLRLRLFEKAPARLPLTFVIGFQATPVKPFASQAHEWRVCHSATYGMAKAELDRLARLGVKTLIFHETWTEVMNYWKTAQRAPLQELVRACHRRGIKLLLYFGFDVSTLTPEWSEAPQVLCVNPEAEDGLRGGYQREPAQRSYTVCYRSSWQDRWIEGIAGALDEYGFDGLYLDSTTTPWGCANPRHGCGYQDAAGQWHATYPVFALRQVMQRLYQLIHPQGGLINVHQSSCCLTPALAFCDSYWDGEQFEKGMLTDDPLKKLSLDAFRAEFMGRNFGIPAEFLVYEEPPAWTFDHALAFTLLHDVRPRPFVNGGLEKLSPVWQAMSDFGVSTAQWHPYWNNAEFVHAEPASVKVSFYSRKQESLLVISNLSPSQAMEGRIDLKTSNARPPSAAWDSITGEKLDWQPPVLRLHLPAMRTRLVRLGKNRP